MIADLIQGGAADGNVLGEVTPGMLNAATQMLSKMLPPELAEKMPDAAEIQREFLGATHGALPHRAPPPRASVRCSSRAPCVWRRTSSSTRGSSKRSSRRNSSGPRTAHCHTVHLLAPPPRASVRC